MTFSMTEHEEGDLLIKVAA